MFMRKRGGRAASGPAVSPQHTAEHHAVQDAEGFVRSAWASALLRLGDDMELAAHAAFKNCDTAYACLAAAWRDADPRKISPAQTALHQALDAARKSLAERDQIHQKVRAELELLDRAARQHTTPALVPQRERDGTDSTIEPPGRPHPPPRQPRRPRPTAHPRRRLPRWLSQLTERRKAPPHQR